MWVTYVTQSKLFEEYHMEIPESYRGKDKKEILKYIKEHDMEDGIFSETICSTDRKFLEEDITIEED